MMSERAAERVFWMVLAGIGFAVSMYCLIICGPMANLDASAFMIVGKGWLHGQIPYRDLWDNKPPGIYLVTMAAAAFGDQLLMVRILSAAAITASGLGLAATVRTQVSSLTAPLTVYIMTILMMSFGPVSLGGGMTETFALPVMILSLLLIFRQPRPGVVRTLFIGSTMAFAIACSLQAIAVIAPITMLIVMRRASWVAFARESILLTTGLVAAGLLIVSPFVATGSIGPMYDALITYNAAYRASSLGLPVQLTFVYVIRYSAMWVPPMVALLIPARGATNTHRLLARIGLLWAVVALAMIVYGGRIYLHYLMFPLPGFMLMLGAGLGRLDSIADRSIRRVLTGVVLFLLMLLIGLQYGGAESLSDPGHIRVEREVADFITSHSDADDRIYVWGYEPWMYVSSNRSPAGRFFYQHPLTTAGYGIAASAETLDSWRTDPPRIIIDVSENLPGQSILPPLLKEHELGLADARNHSEYLEDLRDFVRDHYRLAATLGGLPVYEIAED